MSPPVPPPPPAAGPSVYYPPSSIEEGHHVHEPRPKQSPAQIFCLKLVHNFTQVCLGGIIISALIIANISAPLFKQHIVLVTVGYLILMAQAILSFSPVGWANNLKYDNQKIIYNVMQILGSILAISGCIVSLNYGQTSFTTSHGICGVVAMAFTIINLFAGLLFLFFHKKMNKVMKVLHLCLGALTISIALIALILAFHEFTRFVMGNANTNLSITLTAFTLVGLLLLICIKIFNRILEE